MRWKQTMSMGDFGDSGFSGEKQAQGWSGSGKLVTEDERMQQGWERATAGENSVNG